jgi:mono/diheme cytochrome c family protein
MKTLAQFKQVLACFMLVAMVGFLASASGGGKDKKPWVVPEAAKKVKNPTKADSENLALGKSLFNKHCKSCHGSGGKGDGPKSKELETDPGDFTSADFHKQTDGELFYKTKEGRDDMPSFKKKISSDEDIWLLVDYVRALKK